MSTFLPPLVLELRAKAGELTSELGHARKEMAETAKEAEGSSSRMSRAYHGAAAAGKAITLGAIGAGIAIGGFAVEAAMAGQKADAGLNVALKNAGSSLEALKGPIDDADARLRKFGFTNADTNTALTSMTVALHDPKKALADLGLAADLAKLKNISLAQAGILVAKASEGQTKGLKALGIDLPVVAGGALNVAKAQTALATATAAASAILHAHADATQTSSKFHAAYETALLKVHAAQLKLTAVQSSGSQIMAALTSRIHGTAAAYGQTLSGKIAAAKAQMDSMGETVGGKLIPVITKVIGVATDWTQALMKNKPALIAVSIVIGTILVGAVLAYVASLVTAAITSLSSFASMAASAATWVATQTASLVSLIARWALYGAALLAQKAIMVAQIVVTQGVAAAQWLLNAAMSANPITLVILAIVGLVAIFVLAYNKVSWFRDGVQAAFKGIKAAIGFISTAVGDVISFVRGHWQLILAILTGPIGLAILFIKNNWGKIKSIFTTVVSDITSAVSNVGNILLAPFKWAFNMVATIWDNTIGKIGFTLPGWLGGGSFHMPQIPHFAFGGVMGKTGLAQINERGGETVLLPGGARVLPAGAGPSAASDRGGQHLHFHFTGNTFVGAHPATGKILADMAYAELQAKVLRGQRRNALNPFTGQPAVA